MGTYMAGNLQELSDAALFVTLNWAVGASICGAVMAGLTLVLAVFSPLFHGRFSFLTLPAAIVLLALDLAVLALASALRVAAGGLSL
jgi:hypothetical protein